MLIEKLDVLYHPVYQVQSWCLMSRSTARVIMGHTLSIATCGCRTHIEIRACHQMPNWLTTKATVAWFISTKGIIQRSSKAFKAFKFLVLNCVLLNSGSSFCDPQINTVLGSYGTGQITP